MKIWCYVKKIVKDIGWNAVYYDHKFFTPKNRQDYKKRWIFNLTIFLDVPEIYSKQKIKAILKVLFFVYWMKLKWHMISIFTYAQFSKYDSTCDANN